MIAKRSGVVTACLLLIVSTFPRGVVARSLVFSEREFSTAQAVHPDRFAVGQLVVKPKTLALDLDDLIDRTAGRPSYRAFTRYGGSFEPYWKAIESQRTGKIFEAVLAHDVNLAFARLERPERLVVTAAEGVPTHPADLLLLSPEGQILGRYQAKLGWRAAMAALDDPKYSGQSIVVPQDTREILEARLHRALASALRRGVSPAEQWRRVQPAFDSGRLTEVVGGVAFTRPELADISRRTASQRWDEISNTATNTRQLVTNAERAAKFGRIAGRTIFVVDVAATGAVTYRDVRRFGDGEIESVDLAIKLPLRAANLGLAYAFMFTDPEPITKAIAVAAVVVVIAVDAAHDAIIGARSRAAQQLLESIDATERKQAVLGQLRQEVQSTLQGIEAIGGRKPP